MKIIEVNTRKPIKFDELIKQSENEKHNVVNKRWILYKLLNNEMVKINGQSIRE